MTNWQLFDTILAVKRGGVEVPDTTAEKWSSLEEIALHLGVSKDTLYRWIAKKQMPAHKIGRLWKFKISEVDEWVKNDGALEK